MLRECDFFKQMLVHDNAFSLGSVCVCVVWCGVVWCGVVWCGVVCVCVVCVHGGGEVGG